MTLLESTVVILVILSLVSILFMSGRAWKRGSDRSGCILNIRNAQQMVRSYQNLNSHPVGTPIDLLTDIQAAFGDLGHCPAGGTYDHLGQIPEIGTLVMWCDLAATEGHVPTNFSGW